MFVGPGSINIAGPGDIEGTIGTNASGLVYTASGFAAPTVTVGPNLASVQGAVGGWVLTAGGTAGTSSYDLLAQQGSTVAGGSAFGPLYSLIRQPTYQPISAFSGTLLVASFTGTSPTNILRVTIHPTLPNSYINIMSNLDITSTASSTQIAYMNLDISGATIVSTDVISYTTGANSNNQLSHSLIQAYRYLVPTQDTTYTITMKAYSNASNHTFTINHGHLLVFGNMF
jgi:hypothetical protein